MRKRWTVVFLLGAAGVANAEPDVSFSKPTITGALDAKAATTPMKANKKQLVSCYRDALEKDPAATGNVSAKLTIDREGKVRKVSAQTLLSGDLRSCVVLAVSNLKFAPPKDGQSVEVTFTFNFKPAEKQGGAFAALTGTGDISSGFDDTNIYGGLLGNDPGGGTGGTGWGGIGTGTLGSKPKGPKVSIGQPNATGDLDKVIIRRYIKRNIQKFAYCYEKELLAKPGLKGKLDSEFTIEADGTVSSVTASGVDTEVANCVASVIKAIEFPKPKSGVVSVKYPFTFVPADTKKTP